MREVGATAEEIARKCEAARQGSPDQFFLEAVVASASYENFIMIMAQAAALDDADAKADDDARDGLDAKDDADAKDDDVWEAKDAK